MCLSQMPDKYETNTKPTPTIYETDLKLVREIQGNQQFTSNCLTIDKDGWLYPELLQTSSRVYNFKLQNICLFVLHHFQARARTKYFRGLCQG